MTGSSLQPQVDVPVHGAGEHRRGKTIAAAGPPVVIVYLVIA